MLKFICNKDIIIKLMNNLLEFKNRNIYMVILTRCHLVANEKFRGNKKQSPSFTTKTATNICN
jgi:hypothetical protein